jgi:hypothetical protein
MSLIDHLILKAVKFMPYNAVYEIDLEAGNRILQQAYNFIHTFFSCN